jgi:hypothetical protein
MAKFKLAVRQPTDPAERNQLSVARGSMRMHCMGVRIMGGPNHYEAAEIIHRLTGVFVAIDAGCTCTRSA